MKHTFWSSLCATLTIVMLLMGCEKPATNLTEIDSFVKAKPVWAEGREVERNLTLSFREIIKTSWVSEAYIRLTASCDYRLKINGEFVAHGPSVAAHDHYRIDCYDIAPHLKWGKNIIALEVAGYNDENY